MKKPLGLKQCSQSKNLAVTWALLLLSLVSAVLLQGCESQLTPSMKGSDGPAAKAASSAPIVLRQGDVLKVTFPGSPTFDTSQEVRRDGKITLPLVGEVDAVGNTPLALEKKLLDLYAPLLPSKQVVVEVQSSSFPVYVTGMVLRPGKILSDHPITALEAVMEAGGFDYAKANLKKVTVIRREKDGMKNYQLNLKAVLNGQHSELFYLDPDDIVYVPERFTMF